MLRSTFRHVPGIGPSREARLWDAGLASWDALERCETLPLPPRLGAALRRGVAQSIEHLDRRDANFFTDHLPAGEQWRIFPEFRQDVAYLDIETTGLAWKYSYVTTVAVYDGREVRHYVNGRNLDRLEEDLLRFRVLVTYNGKSFDAPFLDNTLGIRLPRAHIDLRHVLRAIGYTGGLKACERQAGQGRPGLEDVDGWLAVRLWEEFLRTRDETVLETLLAYNIQDVLTLERLMVHAYNRRVACTPFTSQLLLGEPEIPANPFLPDRALIERLLPAAVIDVR